MSSNNNYRSWRTTIADSPLRTVMLVGLAASMSFLSAELAGYIEVLPQTAWPLWPGCALLVALLLSSPRRIWPLLLAAGLGGFALYDLRAGLTLGSTAMLVLANALEVLIATLGVSYSLDGPPRLNSVKRLARYSFFAVLLAPLASAFIATTAFGP